MKHILSRKSLAMFAALVWVLTTAGLTEEMGEMDLYDAAIYDEKMSEESPPLTDASAAEPENAYVSEEAPTPEVIPEEESEWTERAAQDQGEGMQQTDPQDDATQVQDRGISENAEQPVQEEIAQENALADSKPEDGENMAADETETEETSVAAPAIGTDQTPGLWLGVGEQYALSDGSTATYQSDRGDVASVDASSGLVTANAAGVAWITLTAPDGGTTGVLVGVKDAPKSLTLPAASLKLGKGERMTLAVRLPEGSAAAQITFASSKTSVVSVDASGTLFAKKKGTAVITATAYNGAKASCKVTVCKAPSKLSLSTKKAVLCLGETRQLNVKLPKKTASVIRWESDNPAIVQVDAAGNLTGVSAGSANVTAWTFNKKKAVCKVTVLDGKAPTVLTLNAQALTLGVKEKFLLSPTVGAGEAAEYTYKSGKKKIATVSANGVVTAKKAGTAKITVRTQNGLTSTVTVKVCKAPTKVTLSTSALELQAGQTVQLTAKLSKGSASAILWQSSAPDIASVDAEGHVTAVKAGKAMIWASAFNGKKAGCQVTVAGSADTQPDITIPEPGAQGQTSAAARMAANLRASDSLGGKKDAIAAVVELLVNAGFEPAFAAGVGANIYAEGTYGLFESSRYITNYQKRPRYFCYLDGGDYYTKKDGKYVLTAVYMSKEEMSTYHGNAEKRQRFAEANFYLNNYSGRYVQNVDLYALEALMNTLAKGSWEGKFGLGIVQWTGARTAKLVAMYRKHAGSSSVITKSQVIAAENEMILKDFQGDYSSVYSAWKNTNKGALASAEAARSAGSIICTRYEIPVDKESKAVTRGNKAASIYKIMIGG